MEKYTYLMYSKSNELYKIGQSRSPYIRVKQCASRFNMPDLVLISYGLGFTELSAHKYYQEQRIRNEFFRLTDSHVSDFVSAVKDKNQKLIPHIKARGICAFHLDQYHVSIFDAIMGTNRSSQAHHFRMAINTYYNKFLAEGKITQEIADLIESGLNDLEKIND